VRSLGELVEALAKAPPLAEHLRRRDLSRWVRDVFGDHVLANRLQTLEELWEAGNLEQPHLALIAAIRQRYGVEPASDPPRSISSVDFVAAQSIGGSEQ